MIAEPIQIKRILIDKTPILAERMVELQYKRQPELWRPFGSRERELSVRDAEFHIPFLAEAVFIEEQSIFTNYVRWTKKLFKGLNFPDGAMIIILECMQEAITEELGDEDSRIIGEYIDAAIDVMKEPLEESLSFIDINEPHGKLALDYNRALLDGNRRLASELILTNVENGVEIKDIYLNVFQKSQYEIGRLWLENKITVAKEHFCSAATQQIMSQLYPYIFSTERIGKTMIAANVGKELHEIGIRMVADFFEMEGWDTYYLGANTPARSIIQAVEDNEASIIGLSVAMPYHISALREAIDDIRNRFNDKVKIMIGGYALKEYGDKWNQFNADGYAANALDAIELAQQLTAS